MFYLISGFLSYFKSNPNDLASYSSVKHNPKPLTIFHFYFLPSEILSPCFALFTIYSIYLKIYEVLKKSQTTVDTTVF